ncbi:hypothetical protein ACUY28_04450 [Corynebacterium sanguinis]|uniref:ABC transporter ATP-binding protein n=1 Tax=Corynebacterium sanguinis TaxID=2594913 RepID=A0A6C1TZP4_9CORY|nr:hypothetical protein [Corynebacterium sanguinis]MBA4504706.1 hypothetical protein [Corynebacterium sanguinis]MCT1464490.1 hypothetical protein [Corynebacterium sanguinis]MCT1499921.1 hypothetical protein [Corynebacterium sanguinis]MCT1598412.1 hypothetical protein [Corynebacterium sanguinis]MCT2330511.1 hypothetical protein [Corynebacterium sanguinis]
MTSPILRVNDLIVRPEDPQLTFECAAGLTLLVCARESGASTLSMTLAGRFTPASGDIDISGARTTRERFRAVALAGVTLIDSLERSVTVREVIREQVAWAQPWYKRVPKDILTHPLVEPWLEPMDLSELDPSLSVAELDTLTRLRLRVLLALTSRPNASLLVVDDPDQLRNIELRDALLESLRGVAQTLPVVVASVNPDIGDHAEHVIDLREGATL